LAEIRGVKSALIIAALGVGGCVLLSMVMQKAVAIDTERRQLPFVPALAARFGPQLAGPLRVREEPLAGGLELAVSACVRDGIAAEPLARAIGAELWLLALRAGSRAQAARVVLRGEDGAQLVSMPVRRPGPDRSPAPPR
jgi:hypothetical protein